MTILNALLHATNFRNPFLRTLIPSVGAAFALQTAVAIPSILAQSERFYDLSGSLTYLSVTALSLYLPTLRARAAAAATGAAKPAWPSLLAAFTGKGGRNGLNWRQVVLSTAVTIWATRLGSYLFQRVLSDGKDSRFDDIKKSPPRFIVAFVAQATWVSLCLMPVLAINSIPHIALSTLPLFTVTDILGLALYLGGLGFEVTADRQKDAWVQAKKRKEHDEDFLTHGLWSKSRHPNYFGESTLWTGIAVTAAGVLTSNVGQVGMGLAGTSYGRILGLGMCAVSPAFVTFLLLKVSGVPLSENKYDKKYGDRKDYKSWKENTPMFFPKF
jgi:steroid 5-alpha reductase family enzyme